MTGEEARPVLVAFAGKHGSTAAVAEVLAEAMRELGRPATVRPVAEAGDLTPYGAVVLGSAIYLTRWRPEAREFAARHRDALRAMPVWLFSCGSGGTGAEAPPSSPAHVRALARELGARGTVVFGGRLPPEPSTWMERVVVRRAGPEQKDTRDWAAIAHFGREVAVDLARETVAARPPLESVTQPVRG